MLDDSERSDVEAEMVASLTRTLAATTTCIAILGCLVAVKSSANDSDQLTEIGFQIAEQQGIKLDRDDPAEGLGSYLLITHVCSDCHTWPNFAPGGDPYSHQPKQYNIANFLAGGQVFPTPIGNFCSRNITPAPGTKMPAGLSRADFLYVLRTGCDPQDANFRDPQTCGLLQVMPWAYFQDMKQQELNAIYSFLSALPHAEIGSAAQCVPDPQGVAGE
jgi:hypothetical protein